MNPKNRTRAIVVILMVATLLLASPTFSSAVQAAPGLAGSSRAGLEKLSPDLRARLASNAPGFVDIVVQMNASPATPRSAADKPERQAAARIQKYGGVATRSLGIVRGASGKVPVNQLISLSHDPEVLYVSSDSRLVPTGSPYGGDMVDYTLSLNADRVWSRGIIGAGVAVAVLDSGVAAAPNGVDPSRLIASVDLVGGSSTSPDPGGHGTHIAGIVAGKNPDWSGVAPGASIVSVRVIDDTGNANVSTVIQGIQWAVQNRKAYNIRILNLSLGGTPGGSYQQDPLAAAVEVAWHAGIVVVAAAGNSGPNSGTIVTPGYDPYVVTVGSVDQGYTSDRSDDIPSFYSSQGPTIDGLTKPDVVAPGRKLLSTRDAGSYLDVLLPDRIVNGVYFRLSGTSQAAAAVSGVAALLLSSSPNLSPDQVKRRLMSSASPMAGYGANAVGAGYVDAAGVVRSTAVGKQGARVANGFATTVFPLIRGTAPLTWKDLSYNGGVDSRGVAWSNVAWDNVAWDNVTWDNVAWDNVAWDNVAWDNVTWDSAILSWNSAKWDSATWDSANQID